ncbi:PREDICTED: replication factor C subunit 1 isoform X2 [Dinoponera quadriceps]|uniref:Replication factor C subunit 1 n=1 Tax=Dinoponera quadriceps TaxID=609295 RepID=A0A6P3WQI8_DINQU|nr:PREDICTED: replication factor C subunit 1 isoform X2 [Dinoponera quadriceps]
MPRVSNKNGANTAKDIRSYFAPVANSQTSSKFAPKPKKKRVISSDEDEEKPQSSAKRSKESEFHNDADFEAVLSKLDMSQNIQNTKEEKGSIKNADISGNLETTVTKTEVGHNNSKKGKRKSFSLHNEINKGKLHNETNKTNKLKTKEVKSPNKDINTYSKTVISSPPKRKQQSEGKVGFGSNESPNTNDKHTDNVSKKFKNMPNITTSASKHEDIEKQSSNKKKAKETVLFELRIEMKKQRSILYEKYLQRGGARNPGSKTIPTGAKNCLAGLSFLLTGVLDSLERNEAEDLIRNYGGRTVNSVSSKVNYVIVGDEAGPAKLAKANSLGIEQISEDNLLEMIRTRPEGRAEDIKPATTRAKPKKVLNKSESDTSPSPSETKALSSLMNKTKALSSPSPVKTEVPVVSLKKETSTISSSVPKQESNISDGSQKTITNISSQLLVEKYRPKTLKQIIGQQGDRSSAHNLYNWLRDWHKNRQDSKSKDASSKQSSGQNFKAALLSGPPGVGKTSTVQIVCKDLGYDLLEFNASDTRSKTLLKEEISGLLSNTTLKHYFADNNQKTTSKHVLVMDEVDGMAGNEDRGGLQELVNLIKHTEIPIICICNDRSNVKMRTLSCHSYDLKFPKLRVEQIRSSMMSLCYKENISISTDDLDQLIESTNHDIRQVINHLEFFGGRTTRGGQAAGKKHANKNFKLGAFDVAKMVFNASQQRDTTLNDKIGLYFHDYNIAPLFVQENYPAVKLSQVSPLQRLERIARTADSISQGDLVEKVMRSGMTWSLLPLHACFSFIIPGSEMSGSLDAMVRFPGWFGRNSKATRFNRLMQELTTHTRLATGASKDAVNLDYMLHIRNAVVKPLIDNGTDGIEAAIAVMGKYHLMREDLDSMMEITLWPGVRNSMSNLDSKVKAAFTRAYQKNPPMLPYAVNSGSTVKKKSVRDDDNDLVDEEESEEEEGKIDSDAMIKIKKPTASTSKTAAVTKRTGEPVKKRGKRRGRAK